MKKSILAFAAVAAISGSLGANASAQDVKVKDGDTLWGLSKKYEVSVEELKSWNNLDYDMIRTGEVLKVSLEEYHTIKQGDTLWNIANKYGVSVDDIKSWNKLTSDIIHPDRQLVILTEQRTASAPAVVQKASAPAQKAPVAVHKASAPVQKAAAPKKEVVKAAAASSSNASSEEGEAVKELTVRATGYTAFCEGCSGVTATGVDLRANPNTKVISVDPNVIPLGSKVWVEGYGFATASDTGGAIKGNKIDIFFPNKQDAINWGVKQVTVKVLK